MEGCLLDEPLCRCPRGHLHFQLKGKKVYGIMGLFSQAYSDLSRRRGNREQGAGNRNGGADPKPSPATEGSGSGEGGPRSGSDEVGFPAVSMVCARPFKRATSSVFRRRAASIAFDNNLDHMHWKKSAISQII